jgi:hypothetical protein
MIIIAGQSGQADSSFYYRDCLPVELVVAVLQ